MNLKKSVKDDEALTINYSKEGFVEGLPQGKKWKLVWCDEFDGDSLDTNKWILRKKQYPPYVLPSPDDTEIPTWDWPGIKTKYAEENLIIEDSSLKIKLTQDSDGTVRFNRGIVSHFKQAFGYFEARVKFTQQPGWCAAFWLGGYPYEDGADAFIESQEFDILEDFYKQGTPEGLNNICQGYHSNMHAGLGVAPDDRIYENRNIMYTNENIRYSDIRKHDLENYTGWHTVGFQWTPLEHIFYVDGQETFRNDYRNVPVTTVPMCIYLTAGFRTPPDDSVPFYGRLEEAEFPDSYEVDYVRVYQHDVSDSMIPEVKLEVKGEGPFKMNEEVTFNVDVISKGEKIESVMLFSMGKLRAEKQFDGKEEKISFAVNNLFLGSNTIKAFAKTDKGLVGISNPVTVKNDL